MREPPRAYLIGVLDILVTPPTVVRVMICSAPARSLTKPLNAECWFDIIDFPGETFGKARDKLAQYLKEEQYPPFRWVLPFLEKKP